MQWTEKQLEIMRSCSKLLAQVPSVNLTTLSIASELNASEAMLYRHFPSKNKIIIALIEFAEITLFQGTEDILAQTDPNASAPSDTNAAVINLLLIYAEFLSANPGIARLISGEVTSANSSQIMERISYLFDKLEQIIVTMIDKNNRQSNPKLLASTLILVLEGNLKQWIRSGYKYDLVAKQNQLIDHILSD